MTQTVEPISPTTLAEGRTDFGERVDRARAAQSRWASVPLRGRLKILRRLRRLIANEGLALAGDIDGANRDLSQRLVSEVLPLADAIGFLEHRAGKILGTRRWGGRGRPFWLAGTRVEIRRDPVGLVLIVGPSNYPLLLPGVQAIQSLAAGNAVLLKPAPGHARSIERLHDLALRSGLDADLWTLLPDAESSVRAALDCGVDKVFLTGSAQTGAAVMSDLSGRLVPAVMELSGCDALFVCPDASLDLVARGIAFSLGFNGGATCIAPRRVFVPRTLQLELGSRLLGLLDAVPSAALRPADVARLQALRADAVRRGARPMEGRGSRARHLPAGNILAERTAAEQFPPTVVFDATPEMALLQADVMAPIVSLISVDDMDHALRLNAMCPYALGATVFGSEKVAVGLAGRINAGTVLVNDVIVPHADPRVPFGGRGRSGFGVTRGAEGLLEMTRVKAVSVRGGKFRPHFDRPQPGDDEMFADYLRAAHGAAPAARVRAVLGFVRKMVSRPRKTPSCVPPELSGGDVQGEPYKMGL